MVLGAQAIRADGPFGLPDLGHAEEPAHSGHSAAIGPFAEVSTAAEATILCDSVIDILAALFGISARHLKAPTRSTRPVARVRQIGMYITHVTLGVSMTAVGLGFGRDKSTVVHACHTIEDLREDTDFDRIVARAERIVSVAFNFSSSRGMVL